MKPLSATGVIVASAAWVVAWFPSLLPSGSLFQGVTCGVLAALGYAMGTAVAAIVRLVRGTARRRRGHAAPAAASTAPGGPGQAGAVGRSATPRWYALAAGLTALGAVLAGLRLDVWEAAQAADIGAPEFAARWAVASTVGLVTSGLLIMLGRALRRLTRAVAAMIRRRQMTWLPPGQASPLAAAAVTLVCLGLLAGAVTATTMAFDRIDAQTTAQAPPTSSTRSGSPASLIAWDTLGKQGRDFVGQGTDPATIRAFAGLASAPDPQARADLAVQDMLRAGGAEAEVWIGVTTTGNGFIDPVAAQTAETAVAATGGRAALVAIQYSTLPSWISFLVDQSAAQQAGIALYESLAATREAQPPGQRPKLVLYGESLGAFGSPAPFAGLDPAEVAERIDGALWVGPPAATNPITEWTYSGSAPVWQPVLDDGRVARYAASDAATADPPPAAAPWPNPRILVLQNPTDPVVWFAPGLLWREPAWLADPRGPGVTPQTRWTPVLFFFQVALDLPQAVSYPSGYGHNYADALPAAWQQILAP